MLTSPRPVAHPPRPCTSSPTDPHGGRGASSPRARRASVGAAGAALAALLLAPSSLAASPAGPAAPSPAGAPARTGELATAELPPWRIPIHTAPDGPDGGPYGIWAAGPDYKVSFHDGFAFYPVLGEDYAVNRPLSWTTESVSVGGAVLVDGSTPSQTRHADWRFEIRYPGLVEAYDVRADGVEQTFTIAERPDGADDLVVTGRWSSTLASENRSARHERLVFRDPTGRALVEYGAPVAIDAAGRRGAMRASYEDGTTRLELDAAWLASATYPVTVDPVVSAVEVSPGRLLGGDVAHGPQELVFLVEARYSSGVDQDVRGVLLFDGDLADGTTVFSDLSETLSSRNPEVAYVAGAGFGFPIQAKGRWVVAVERSATQGVNDVYVYVHDVVDPTLNGGDYLNVPSPDGSHSRPTVGGTVSPSSDHALIVMQSDVVNGPDRITSVIVDASDPTPSLGPLRTVSSTPGYRGVRPCVSRNSDGPGGFWVAAWKRQGDPATVAGTQDVRMASIDTDGNLVADVVVKTGFVSNPKIDGRQERYLVVWEDREPDGSTFYLRARRYDWPGGVPLPMTERIVASNPGGFVNEALRLGENRSVAYDSNTRSHWAIAYHDHVHRKGTLLRVGFTGGIVEAVRMSPERVYDPFLCYDPGDYEFPVVATTSGAEPAPPFSVQGARFAYDPDAVAFTYGIGCNGEISSNNAGLPAPPFAGSEFLGIDMTGGIANAPSVLLLSGLSAKTPLPDGCFLNVASPWQVAAFGVADAAGNAFAGPFNLGDAPPFFGDLRWQWLQFPAGKPVQSTEGLRTNVR